MDARPLTKHVSLLFKTIFFLVLLTFWFFFSIIFFFKVFVFNYLAHIVNVFCCLLIVAETGKQASNHLQYIFTQPLRHKKDVTQG